jgi:hypothetical protein
MIFTLEALEAKHGDALLLHYGDSTLSGLIAIDGGPAGVYRASLKPRLDALRTARGGNTPLPIRLLMVSHIDDDHIRGVLDLTRSLVEMRKEHRVPPWQIVTLWHNSFDDVVGNAAPLSAALEAAVRPVATGGATPPQLPLHRDSALVVASVQQGRTLRDDARALGLNVNSPWGTLVCVSADRTGPVDLGGGLTFTVLGPSRAQIDELHKGWDQTLEKMKGKPRAEAQALAAAFVDESVYNLSSIVVMATAGTRRMLLTGDARGDFILNGLEAAGLLENGTVHVELLKVPHHGSDRNVTTDFFRRVTADHYVISGDGRHGNPEVGMLRMLAEARGQDEYHVYLTNREDRLERFFEADRPRGRRYEVTYRADTARSVSVALGS